MKRTWTIIGVRDVPESFKWYQSLFGQPATRPHHSYFGQLLDSDGTVLLCLHQWESRSPFLMSLADARNGLRCSSASTTSSGSAEARALVAHLDEEPHVNPNTRTKSFHCEIRTDTTSR